MSNSDDAVINKFFKLAFEAERIETETPEAFVEPAFESVLAHIHAHPESRKLFADAFLKIAHDPNLGSPELFQFCMHALRWEEVKIELTDWLKSESSERVRHVLRKLIMSFDDDWYDADAYARFRNARSNELRLT